MAEAGFTGFRPAAFDFLRGLAANNEKTWFEAHRSDYEREVKASCAALAMAVSRELAGRELPLEGDGKRSLFRIHRDVRFSRDKRPYKTEVGTVWFRQGGGKNSPGVLYFHLAPGGREAVRVRPGAFLAVRDALKESGLELSMEGQLSRMPRGFEDLRGSDVADAIRLRSFMVSRPLSDEEAGSPALVGHVVRMAADALPLLRFGWGAIDEARTGTMLDAGSAVP